MDADQPDQTDRRPLVHKERVRNRTSQSIDWYSEGETRIVEADGVHIEVRFVGRKGRKARIVITAPSGSTFGPKDPG